MEPFIRLKPGTLTLRPEMRVLKAADYQTFVDARQMLADAQQQAQALLTGASQEYERQKQRGYADGMNEAKMDMAEQMMETAERTVDYFAQVEEKVAALVMTALRKVLGEFDDVDLTLRVVRNALQVVRSQPHVTIRVTPAQEPALRQRLNELLAGYNSVGMVEIVGDPRLGPGGCILETEIGVVDASIDVQLQALERALKARIQTAPG
ncbi:MAG TPA: HrpE/YscL family type III secretion apparatus protein [Gammaproteobacteria bacterium]|nr:HrpE/YscL family type III secretion apparatus protein [Gammaproteobacteria bacterium]